MRFQEYLIEKLQPSQFRDIIKQWKKSGISKIFDHVFGKKDRIYEPYSGKETNIGRKKSETEQDIRAFLEDNPDSNYRLIDYNKGLVIHKDTRKELKIMKALTNLQNQIEKELKDKNMSKFQQQFRQQNLDKIEKLKKAFVNDKSRELSSGKKLLVCFSRHAYDIAGMSTDRGWESCMALPGDKHKPEGGTNWTKVTNEVNQGTIVAYLIKEEDKNIQNPIGRMLIKPYINTENPNQLYFVACIGGYGTTTDDFKNQVTEWTKKLNINVPKGIYKIHPDLEHSNIPNETIGKDIEEIKTWDGLLKNSDDFVKGKFSDDHSIGKYIYIISEIAEEFYQDTIEEHYKCFDSIVKLFEKNFTKGLAFFYKFKSAVERSSIGLDRAENFLKWFDILLVLTKHNMPDPKWKYGDDFNDWWKADKTRKWTKWFPQGFLVRKWNIAEFMDLYKRYFNKLQRIWG